MAAMQMGISGWLQRLWDGQNRLESVFVSGESLAKGVRQ